MGIRIDPSLEFVWRDVHTVQIGVDPPRALVPVASAAEERFLTALRRETSRDALPVLAAQARCTPSAAAEVLAAVAPVLVDRDRTGPPRVELHGSGAFVDLLRDHLSGEGVTVVRNDDPLGGPLGAPPLDTQLAVAVTDHVLDPAVRSAWIRRAEPHLTVVIGDGHVRIGPVIEPDRGPCLHCVELARVDEDDHWPTLATQLWGRSAAPLSPHRAAAVAATVCRVVLDRLARGPGTARNGGPGTGTDTGPSTATGPSTHAGRSTDTGTSADSHTDRLPATDAADHAAGLQLLVDRATLAVTTRSLLPHPRCACRALPGNDSLGAPHRVPLPAAPG